MKKLILSMAAATMLLSCQNDDSAKQQTSTDTSGAGVSARRSCASTDVLARQLQEDPGLATKMNQVEAFTQNYIQSQENAPAFSRLVNGKIELPVIVNVLYRTTAENISLAQIQSQIDILNKDFNALNADLATSNPFNAVKA
ncbi:MAG: zinc metalloprotease, partial [Flavobacterium sp.]|nr:zinc metalloprotease [Flavobacterium sp.]